MVDFCTTRGGAYDPIIHLITYIHCTLDSFGFDYPRLKKRIIKIINYYYLLLKCITNCTPVNGLNRKVICDSVV